MALRTTDIVSWSASSSLRGAYSASISLLNSNNDYSILLLKGKDFELTVDAQIHTSPDIDDPDDVFEGVKKLIKGVIGDIRPQEGLSTDVVSIGIKSYFAKLARKPIATQSDMSGGISEILTTFAKLDEETYDLTLIGTGNVAGPLNGNNMLEQIRKCAQAARSYVFVDHEGKMKVEAWKDASDPVEFEIPKEAIIGASRADSPGILPTQIRMRGGYYQRYDVKAEMNRSGANPAGGESPGAQPASAKGPGSSGGVIKKCRKQGMGEGQKKMVIKGMDADADDLYSSEVSLSSGDTVVDVEITDGGGMTITSEPASGWEPTGTGSVVSDSDEEIRVEGRIRDMRASESSEVDAPVAQEHEGVKDKKEYVKQEVLGSGGVMIHMFPMGGGPGPAGGAGSAGGGGNQSPVQLSVSMSEIQLEAYSEDPDLRTEFGTVYEQMENTAIVSREQLHDCIVRRFQEIKMTRKAWEVSCAFMPAININNVVQFTTPRVSTYKQTNLVESGGEVVTGVVTQLSYAWNADSNQLTQKMVVESFEDIGATTYVSSNLIRDWRLLGYGGNSEWEKSSEYAYVSGGRIRLTVSDNASGVGWAQFDQTGMEVGAEYTFSFETDNPLGSDNIDTTYNGTSIGTAKTVTFTATATSYRFKWELAATSADTQSWLINQISLIKTHMA